MSKKIKKAILSLSDKSEIKLILNTLKKYRVNVISSGGTSKEIKKLENINVLIISVDSDVCFYPEEQVEFENLLKENGIKTSVKVINSTKGHDCFLLEPELFENEFQNFI